MIHVIYIWLIIAALWAGYLAGAVKWHEKDSKNTPAIGYLWFNTHDPAKEFLELHITEDIDIEKPPEYVRLLVLVNNGGGKNDGSKG